MNARINGRDETEYPLCIKIKRDIALAVGSVAKLASVRAGAAKLAIPTRHGFILQSDATDALFEQAGNVGLIDDVGEEVVLLIEGGLKDGWAARSDNNGFTPELDRRCRFALRCWC
jgi:hypothetical protein